MSRVLVNSLLGWHLGLVEVKVLKQRVLSIKPLLFDRVQAVGDREPSGSDL